jgi:hypothetical protein
MSGFVQVVDLQKGLIEPQADITRMSTAIILGRKSVGSRDTRLLVTCFWTHQLAKRRLCLTI